MRFWRALAAAALFAAEGGVHAQVSGTIGVVSDYNFRGISQSAHDPAPQASIDWAAPSGWYLGLFGSKIELGDDLPRLEADLYGGFKGSLGGGVGYDFGSVYYNYHIPTHTDFNYVEVYAGTSFRWASAKLYFSPRFGGDAGAAMLGRGASAFYFTSDAAYPMPDNFSLIGHLGYSFGRYWDRERDLGYAHPYLDWAAGAGYLWRHYSVTLRWVDGSDLRESQSTAHNILSTRGRVIFGVSTSFPWTAAGTP